MTNSLHQEPERDEFKHESPIRAFTTWSVQGLYALGKAIWYGESESELLRVLARAQGWRAVRPNLTGIKDPAAFLEDRIADQPQFTQNIARMLWAGYGQRELRAILEAIQEHRFHLDCGRGLAI